jgi:hypothetical protein
MFRPYHHLDRFNELLDGDLRLRQAQPAPERFQALAEPPLQCDLLRQPVEMQLDHLPERATGMFQPLPDLLKPESQLPQRFDLL